VPARRLRRCVASPDSSNFDSATRTRKSSLSDQNLKGGTQILAGASLRGAGNNTGPGSPVNPQPGRLRYVAQASAPASFGSVPLPFQFAIMPCRPNGA
jgi:hypothetical protein